jgi:hypothetical protein
VQDTQAKILSLGEGILKKLNHKAKPRFFQKTSGMAPSWSGA